MKVSKTLELSIPEDVDIDKLERYLAKELERFGKQVFGKVLQEIETKKLEEAKGRLPGDPDTCSPGWGGLRDTR